MKIFEIAWIWYESYSPYLFIGDDTITKEKWEADCELALKHIGKKYLATEESWAGASEWVKSACEALEAMGYTHVSPVKFSIFGNYILESRDSGGEFAKIIGEELFDKAIEHNKRLRAKLGERMI